MLSKTEKSVESSKKKYPKWKEDEKKIGEIFLFATLKKENQINQNPKCCLFSLMAKFVNLGKDRQQCRTFHQKAIPMKIGKKDRLAYFYKKHASSFTSKPRKILSFFQEAEAIYQQHFQFLKYDSKNSLFDEKSFQEGFTFFLVSLLSENQVQPEIKEIIKGTIKSIENSSTRNYFPSNEESENGESSNHHQEQILSSHVEINKSQQQHDEFLNCESEEQKVWFSSENNSSGYFHNFDRQE